MSGRKRKVVSVGMEQKLNALRRLEMGENLGKIAADLNVGKSTVFDWKHKRSQIEWWCSQRIGIDTIKGRKRMKCSEYEFVNEALYEWYLVQRDSGVHVTGSVFQEQALKLYEKLKGDGKSGFTASNGWLDKWKQRYGICKQSTRGEQLFVGSGSGSGNLEEKVKQQNQRNIESPVGSRNLTGDSVPPASTSTTLATVTSQKRITRKKSTTNISEKPPTAPPAVIKTNDIKSLLDKIRQLEEKNAQLQTENESYKTKNVMLETQKIKLMGQLQRCFTWVVNVGQDKFTDLADNKLQNRRICSNHFNQSEFMNEKRDKLTRNAVPNPCFQGDAPVEEESIKESVINISENMLPPHMDLTSAIATIPNVGVTPSFKSHQAFESLWEHSELLASTSADPKPRHNRNVCSFKGCGRSKARFPNMHFYSFPITRPSICKLWIRNCANKSLETIERKALNRRVVCQEHFEEDCFLNFVKSRLRANAVPTIVSITDPDTPEVAQDKDPLDLGEHTLVYEQHSERLTVGPSSSNPVVPIALVTSVSSEATGSGERSNTVMQLSHQDFLDPDDPGDDSNAFMDNIETSEVEIDIDPDAMEPTFEEIDIKPEILIEEEGPAIRSPLSKKRSRDASPPSDWAGDSNTGAKRSKGDLLLKKKLVCDFGDGGDEDDDNFHQNSGDELTNDEDSAKVRRAYDLLRSVFDKKDKYDIFCERLAGRLRALSTPKVCHHVQQMLVTVIEDAESGKFDNI